MKALQHVQRINDKTVGDIIRFFRGIIRNTARGNTRIFLEFSMILRIFNAKTNQTVNIYGKITVNLAKIRKIMLNSKIQIETFFRYFHINYIQMTLTGYSVTFNLFFQLASELLKNYFITILL